MKDKAIYILTLADLRSGRTKEEMERVIQKKVTEEKYEDCAEILRAIKDFKNGLR